jgi:hypothetical protein
MPEFELRPRQYDRLPDFLVRSVPGFEESPEFARVREFRELPGVVVGALTPFLLRLEATSQKGMLDAGAADSLEGLYRAIEAMASSDDLEVQNALVVEVFEHLHGSRSVVARIENKLHPRSRALYSRWTD